MAPHRIASQLPTIENTNIPAHYYWYNMDSKMFAFVFIQTLCSSRHDYVRKSGLWHQKNSKIRMKVNKIANLCGSWESKTKSNNNETNTKTDLIPKVMKWYVNFGFKWETMFTETELKCNMQ